MHVDQSVLTVIAADTVHGLEVCTEGPFEASAACYSEACIKVSSVRNVEHCPFANKPVGKTSYGRAVGLTVPGTISLSVQHRVQLDLAWHYP